MLPLTLYSRAGCHLCQDAQAALDALGWPYTRVDVDSDPALKERHGHDVPVLASGERVLLRGVITRGRLLKWREGRGW